MDNRLIVNPTFEEIYDTNFERLIKYSIIHIQEKDIKHFIEDAKSVIILEGKGTGNNRISDAIEDAQNHVDEIIKGCQVTGADKYIVLCSFGKDYPMMITELESINRFFDSVGNNKDCLWGLAILPESQDDTIIINIILAFK